MVVPYNDAQLTVVLIACLIIGIFLGGMAVGVSQASKEKKH